MSEKSTKKVHTPSSFLSNIIFNWYHILFKRLAEEYSNGIIRSYIRIIFHLNLRQVTMFMFPRPTTPEIQLPLTIYWGIHLLGKFKQERSQFWKRETQYNTYVRVRIPQSILDRAEATFSATFIFVSEYETDFEKWLEREFLSNEINYLHISTENVKEKLFQRVRNSIEKYSSHSEIATRNKLRVSRWSRKINEMGLK